jgi:predicted TPR repeat methyltransferase
MNDSFEQARLLFLQGVQAFQAGDLDAADRHFEASLQRLPGRPSTLMNLAAVRIRLGRPAEALPLLDAALAQEPTDAEAWGHRGTALAALGRTEEAVAAFDRVLALAPAQPAALFQRARHLTTLGRHAEALVSLDALLAVRPEDIEAWFKRGEALQALGRPTEALAAYERVLALQPAAALAWTQRGGILKDLGRLPEAAESFRRALALGGDAEINGYFLASIEGGTAPVVAPRAYVEGLFDQYADEFDEHLVGRLGYRTPQLLADLLPPGWHGAAALDLGCGTGLMAPLLRQRVDAIDGVDLSSRMLDKARALGLYRELHHADVSARLEATTQRYALVAAADVFVYVGALDAVYAGAARVLEPDGLFLYSVEESDAGQDLQLRPSSRYAHSEAYLRRLADRHGFEVRRVERATLRHDQRRPIGGLCVLLARR